MRERSASCAFHGKQVDQGFEKIDSVEPSSVTLCKERKGKKGSLIGRRQIIDDTDMFPLEVGSVTVLAFEILFVQGGTNLERDKKVN